jgi:hypothetical protein
VLPEIVDILTQHIRARLPSDALEGPEFTDHYTEALERVIEAKWEGKKPPEMPELEAPTGKVAYRWPLAGFHEPDIGPVDISRHSRGGPAPWISSRVVPGCNCVRRLVIEELPEAGESDGRFDSAFIDVEAIAGIILTAEVPIRARDSCRSRARRGCSDAQADSSDCRSGRQC